MSYFVQDRHNYKRGRLCYPSWL